MTGRGKEIATASMKPRNDKGRVAHNDKGGGLAMTGREKEIATASMKPRNDREGLAMAGSDDDEEEKRIEKKRGKYRESQQNSLILPS